MFEATEPKLTNDFFRLGNDLLCPRAAFQIVLTVLLEEGGVNGSDTLRAENVERELAVLVGQEFIDSHSSLP